MASGSRIDGGGRAAADVLLTEVLARARTDGRWPDRSEFRIDHEQYMDTLTDLERTGFLAGTRNAGSRVTARGLTRLSPDVRAEVASDCDQLVDALRDHYRATKGKGASLAVADLAARTGIPLDRVRIAASFLEDHHEILHNLNYERGTGFVAEILVGEGVLRARSFSALLEALEGKGPSRRAAGRPAYPPAELLWVSVEGYRCFKDRQELRLASADGAPARWTVILGDNGVGKTTLLQAIAYLSPSPSDPTVPWLGEDAPFDPTTDINQSHRSTVLRAGLVPARGERSVGAPAPSEVMAEYTRTPLSHRLYEGIPDELSGTLVCAYGAARRQAPVSLADAVDEHPAASLFSDEAALRNAEELVLLGDYRAKRDDPGDTRAVQDSEELKRLLVAILEDVSDIRIDVPEGDRLAKPRVMLETPFGWVRPESLSLGYRTLMAWTVDLAARLFERYPRSPNPLAEPVIVLVDEIDLHLHPAWQRKLLDHLSRTFTAAQFIVTAHSPLVVQAATAANLVVLRRDGDRVIIDDSPMRVAGWRVDQVLMSDLFGLASARSLDVEKLLDRRRVLLQKQLRTEKEEEELRDLDAKVDALPDDETPETRRLLDVIRRAAERLEKEATADGGSQR